MESLPVKLSEKIITGFGKVTKMPVDLFVVRDFHSKVFLSSFDFPLPS